MKIGIAVGVAILLIIGGIAIFLFENSEEIIQDVSNVVQENIEDSEKEIENIKDSISEEKQEEQESTIEQVEEAKENSKIITKKVEENSVKEQSSTVTIPQVIVPEITVKSEIVEQEEIIETVIDNTVIPSNSVGILKIPKISISQAVLDGHSLDVIKDGLGHFDETAYWNGNVGILGHNIGKAGYFEKLKNLVVGDSISYTTEYGTRNYKVSSITEIADTDWSVLANTKDNRITMITCVKGVPEKRLCVQAIEVL